MKTQDSTRRHFSLLAAAALAAGAFGLPSAALAQAKFPSKAVTIVVPYTAGGASDVQARLIGQKLSQLWGQPVVGDNKPATPKSPPPCCRASSRTSAASTRWTPHRMSCW